MGSMAIEKERAYNLVRHIAAPHGKLTMLSHHSVYALVVSSLNLLHALLC